MDAGELRHRLMVMECRRSSLATDGSTSFDWAIAATVWGKVELGTGSNLFSRVGIGARDATITLRDRRLDLHQALRWGCHHLFLTSLVRDRGHITAKAAVVAPTDWAATRCKKGIDTARGNRPKREPLPPLQFPGVLTEKYLGNTPPFDDGHATVEARYVLVTPKVVELSPGDLVTTHDPGIAGTYVVELCHCLDPYKNEYEIYRKRDV